MLAMNLGKGGEQEVSQLSPLGKGEIIGWSAMVEPHIYKLGGYAEISCKLIHWMEINSGSSSKNTRFMDTTSSINCPRS